MAAQWFYSRGAQQLGPVSFEDLQRLAASGQLQPSDMVWTEGMANWSPASAVANLLPAGGAMPALATEPPGQPRPVVPGGYQGPTMGVQMGADQVGGQQPPKNYLVQSILVTLCCCLIFGIIAIVYAAQVNGKFQAGDYAGAEEASRKAKFWCWMAFGFGLVANLIFGGIQFAAQSHR